MHTIRDLKMEIKGGGFTTNQQISQFTVTFLKLHVFLSIKSSNDLTSNIMQKTEMFFNNRSINKDIFIHLGRYVKLNYLGGNYSHIINKYL